MKQANKSTNKIKKAISQENQHPFTLFLLKKNV